jgi:peptide/nickel transport system permease protein
MPTRQIYIFSEGERSTLDLKTYFVRRVLLFFGVVLGVMILTFLLTRVLPADPIRALAGPTALPSVVEGLRHKYGLDKPVPLQFIDYMQGILTGNLGLSIRTGDQVVQDIATFLPATIELAIFGFIIALALGVVTGSVAAMKRGKATDHILRAASLLGLSMPSFWLGIVALIIFSLTYPIFPGGGRVSFTITSPPHITGFLTLDSLLVGRPDIFLDALAHLALPALVLGVWGAAWITRHTRSSTIEVTRQDYVMMARAKGLPERFVFFRHIFRNALIPPLTIAGLVFGSLLSAAIPVELVFSFPGIGLYAYNSNLAADYNAIVAVALVTAISFSLSNLLVDLLYPIIDPRIKYD